MSEVTYGYQACLVDSDGNTEWLETIHGSANDALADGIQSLCEGVDEVWLDRWTYIGDSLCGVAEPMYASNGRSDWARRKS